MSDPPDDGPSGDSATYTTPFGPVFGATLATPHPTSWLGQKPSRSILTEVRYGHPRRGLESSSTDRITVPSVSSKTTTDPSPPTVGVAGCSNPAPLQPS